MLHWWTDWFSRLVVFPLMWHGQSYIFQLENAVQTPILNKPLYSLRIPDQVETVNRNGLTITSILGYVLTIPIIPVSMFGKKNIVVLRHLMSMRLVSVAMIFLIANVIGIVQKMF